MVSTQVLRLMVDVAVNGTLLSKSYNKAYVILERIVNNNYQWAGVHNVDVLAVLSAQVTLLTNIVKAIITTSTTLTKLLRYLVFITKKDIYSTIVLEILLQSTKGAFTTNRTTTILIQTLKIVDRDITKTSHRAIRINKRSYPVDKTCMFNHLDFTCKIKGKEIPAMINSILLKL